MGSQMLASRAQTAALQAAPAGRVPAPRRAVIAQANAASRRTALTWLLPATVGLVAAQPVRAGLFGDSKGGEVPKTPQQKSADQRQLEMNKKRPQAPEYQAGLGSQGTQRQNLGPEKLIKQK